MTTTKRTYAQDVIAGTVTYKGRKRLHIEVSPDHKGLEQGGRENNTFQQITGKSFHNDVIETDVADKLAPGAPKWARGFVGTPLRSRPISSGQVLHRSTATQNLKKG